MKNTSFRYGALVASSLGILALSACASSSGDSRYGGEAVQCVPASMPCSAVVPYGPVSVQAPPLIYMPAPPVAVAPPPQAAPLPAQPASPVYEPYVPEPSPPVYSSEPYSPAAPVTEPEPYYPPAPLPPNRNNRPVVDDPAELPCPEGSIPGYGGTDCISITVPRK